MNILFSFSTENSFVVLLAFTNMPWVEKVDVQELHCWCKKIKDFIGYSWK